jgi:hypothetical protein
VHTTSFRYSLDHSLARVLIIIIIIIIIIMYIHAASDIEEQEHKGDEHGERPLGGGQASDDLLLGSPGSEAADMSGRLGSEGGLFDSASTAPSSCAPLL